LPATKFTPAYLTALILFVIVGACQRQAEAREADSLHTMSIMMDTTVQQTYNYRFEDALATTDSMISDYPDRPEGYIYKCGIYSKMLAEDSFNSPDSIWRMYKGLVERACELSKTGYEANSDDVENIFHYASALVYRSRYDAWKKDWLGLMSDGVKSRRLLEKAIKLRPDFYDAYSGIGAFNYYAAHLPWYLKPVALILGIKGNEEEGIVELKRAARLGNYSRAEAASFLTDVVYSDKKEFRKIAKLALDLHKQYPGNLDFVRTLCFASYKLSDYRKVIRYAYPILARYRGDSIRYLSLAYIRFYRGESYAALNTNYEGAILDYSKAIQMGESVLVSQAYYGRGALYERLGKRRRAIADFDTTIELNGDDRSCKLARAALDSLKSQ
jgi:tetratricopeptide (TPR) repeat protein